MAEGAGWTVAGLWLAVIASGVWHGVNPGMGWPLAVSAALIERRPAALAGALTALGLGHLAAMAAVLLPFALLAVLVEWRLAIQAGAAALVAGFGLWKLLEPRHPRALARIPPAKLALWSFAVAVAHGAGLMLVPVYLGLCLAVPAPAVGANVATAMGVSLVHAGAMIATGGLVAVVVYRYLALRFIARSWFNLDAVWALSLIAVGLIGLAAAWP